MCTLSAFHGGYWHCLRTVELWGSHCLQHCYNPAIEEDLFRGLETKHSVSSVRHQSPAPQAALQGGLCELQRNQGECNLWCEPGLCKEPHYWPSQDEITSGR